MRSGEWRVGSATPERECDREHPPPSTPHAPRAHQLFRRHAPRSLRRYICVVTSTPRLSIVVIFHNMLREAARTLFTLSRAYQKNISNLPYEVIAIDSASTEPLSPELVRGFGDNFRHEYFATDSVSPVAAVNHGVAQAAGDLVMVMVDGAHLLSPGVVANAVKALSLFDNPLVATLPVHLGPGRQDLTVAAGYNQQQEDRLLASVDWKADGYELFRLTGSPSDASLGWFGCLFESNCFALRKSTFQKLGGFHGGFQSRGGGLANLDFFREAVQSPEIDYVLLLGEASFHQMHGWAPYPLQQFHEEYAAIRGRPYDRPRRRPFYLGSLSRQAIRLTKISAHAGLEWWEKNQA
jgi:hypothetical protein